MSVEEYGFLDHAFEHDLPVKVQQRNPKAGAWRARYEKYEPARTLREIKRLGGSWADIVWDFERGYIDFVNQRASMACIEDLEEQMYRELRFANGESTFADDEGHVVVGGSFSTLSLEESIKQDFAVVGVDHLE